MQIELLDIVVLNEDLPAEGLRRGNIGTVIELLEDDAFLVEFVSSKGAVYAQTLLRTRQLLKVFYEPVEA